MVLLDSVDVVHENGRDVLTRRPGKTGDGRVAGWALATLLLVGIAEHCGKGRCTPPCATSGSWPRTRRCLGELDRWDRGVQIVLLQE